MGKEIIFKDDFFEAAEEQEEVEITRNRLVYELTENEVENMSSKDIFRMIYDLNDEKSNADLLEEYNETHSNQVATISDSFDIDKKRIDEDNARDVFMQIFRSELLNTLSVDDRHEVFSQIMLGSSDITAELLTDLILDYSVDDIAIIKTDLRIANLLKSKGLWDEIELTQQRNQLKENQTKGV